MYGHDECVRSLIRCKADVKYAKSDGFTALILAAGFNQLDTVRTLVRAGADLEAATDPVADKKTPGCTPLLYASTHGKGAVVRALMQLGANPLKRDANGATALVENGANPR